MFTKILVPLDGSEIAAKVLPRVIELAMAFKSKDNAPPCVLQRRRGHGGPGHPRGHEIS